MYLTGKIGHRDKVHILKSALYQLVAREERGSGCTGPGHIVSFGCTTVPEAEELESFLRALIQILPIFLIVPEGFLVERDRTQQSFFAPFTVTLSAPRCDCHDCTD